MKKYISTLLSFGFLCMSFLSAAQNFPDLSATSVPGNSTPITLPTAYNQGSNPNPSLFNYTRIFEPQTATQNPNIDENSAATKMSTTYLDGLGRKIQEIRRRENYPSSDWIQFYDYRQGLTQYSFLPYGIAMNSKFQQSPFIDQRKYYQNLFPNEASASYSAKQYVSDQNGHAQYAYSAGKSMVGQGRGIKSSSQINAASDIVIWGIDPISQWPVKKDFYAAGQLDVKITDGSDQSRIEEYTDKEGKLICKKIVTDISAPQYIYTYYVYDVFGGLRYTLSPKAVEKIKANNWTLNNVIIQNLTDFILYDKFGRITEKHFAGEVGNHYTVYDDKNRPVLTQSPNQRDLSKWAFTLYDQIDRPKITGMLSSSDNRLTWQQTVDTKSTGSNTPSDIEYYIVYNEGEEEYPVLLSGCDILNYTFYDNYDHFNDPVLAGITYDASVYTNNLSTSYYAVNPAVSARTKGMVTATKSRVVNTTNANISGLEDWTYAVNYYDEKGRLIETVGRNYLNGREVIAQQYDFKGRILRNIVYHKNPNCPQKSSTTIVKDYVYAPATFKLTTIQQKIDNEDWRPLASYQYNELGQVTKKTIGSIEVQDKEYNIRGHLTGINRAYAEDTKSGASNTATFGESIRYDYGFKWPLYNGNVSGIIWRGAQAAPPRSYGYQYDQAGRLIQADFGEYSQPAGFTFPDWNTINTDYTEGNITYDANGNIITIKRVAPAMDNGVYGPTVVDDLKMHYASNDVSNRMTYTEDNITSQQLTDFDFKDKGTTTSDYSYDKAGNIATDNNKQIHIEYNYFNKPESITFTNNDVINYIYDAAGNKIIEQYNIGGQTYDMEYIDQFIYKDDKLYMVNHDEGYSLLNSGNTFDYYFYVKDHLENVRNVVQSIQSGLNYDYLATHEIASANLENAIFDNINIVRGDKPGSTDPNDTKAVILDGNDPGKRIGTSLLLTVMAGDKFEVNTDAYFEGDMEGESEVPAQDIASSIVSTLIGGQGGFAGGMEGGQASRYIQQMFTPDNYIQFYDDVISQNIDPTAPKAFLNYILFDENFKVISEESGAIQIGSQPNVWANIGTQSPITVGRNGYLAVYVSTSSFGSIKPAFDKFNVKYYRGTLVEENHYYPYGLTATIATKNPIENRYLYLTNQLERTNGLHYYDFHARQYDPQLGKFISIDPMHEFHTGYIYSADNPVVFKDKMGMSSDVFGGGDGMYYLWKGMGISGGGSLGFSMDADARHAGRMAYDKFLGNVVVAAGAAVLSGGLTAAEGAYVASEEAGAATSARTAYTSAEFELASQGKFAEGNASAALSQGATAQTERISLGQAAGGMPAAAMGYESNAATEYGTMMAKISPSMDATLPATQVENSFNAYISKSTTASNELNGINAVKIGGETTTGNGSSPEEMVTLYRNFGWNEYNAFKESKSFSIQSTGFSGKQFWIGEDGLNWWKKTDWAKPFDISIQVPKSFIDPTHSNYIFTETGYDIMDGLPHIDGYPGGTVSPSNMGLFNSIFNVNWLRY